MPVRKVKGGFRWGSSGKVFKTKAAAAKQGRTIEAARKARTKKPKGRRY
jgi:hypothetical protein